MHSRDLVYASTIFGPLYLYLSPFSLDLKPDDVLLNYRDRGDSALAVTAAKIADIENNVHLSQDRLYMGRSGMSVDAVPEAPVGVDIEAPTNAVPSGLIMRSCSASTPFTPTTSALARAFERLVLVCCTKHQPTHDHGAGRTTLSSPIKAVWQARFAPAQGVSDSILMMCWPGTTMRPMKRLVMSALKVPCPPSSS